MDVLFIKILQNQLLQIFDDQSGISASLVKKKQKLKFPLRESNPRPPDNVKIVGREEGIESFTMSSPPIGSRLLSGARSSLTYVISDQLLADL